MGLKKIALHWQIIIGLILGVIWALVASSLGWGQFTIDWIDPFGQIFIRLLKLIAVPLVLFSIISGISGLTDTSKLGRVGAKTISIYVVTTMVAVVVGLGLVNIIKPGEYIDDEQRTKNRIAYELWVGEANKEKEVVKMVGESIMDNPEMAGLVAEVKKDQEKEAEKEKTEEEKKREKKIKEGIANAEKTKKESPMKFIIDMVPSNIFSAIAEPNMLQVIFFAIFFGIVLVMMPKDKSKSVVDVVNGINEVFLRMVDIIMRAAPFFVFCLLAGVIAKMAGTPQEVLEIFKGLGVYAITVVVGLAFMIFVFYPMLLRLFVRRISYSDFFKGIGPAQMLAFSTSSSAATLPVTMECVEDNLGASKNMSSFVLPIGATVNMDGTSLYQAIAVIFLAQMHMIDLSFGAQMTIVLTATLASIGSAAVPSAGLIMLIVVLQSVGLNPAWIAIIFPIDRILDMCRTVVNVTGDATVTTIIANSEGELDLEKQAVPEQ